MSFIIDTKKTDGLPKGFIGKLYIQKYNLGYSSFKARLLSYLAYKEEKFIIINNQLNVKSFYHIIQLKKLFIRNLLSSGYVLLPFLANFICLQSFVYALLSFLLRNVSSSV